MGWPWKARPVVERKAPTLAPASPASGRPRASGSEWIELGDLKDPRLAAFMRAGSSTASGASVTAESALRNTAVFRAVDLISTSIGMLPLILKREGADEVKVPATDHALYPLLLEEPNASETAFEFKSTMQARALLDGDAFAYVLRSGDRIAGLELLDRGTVKLVRRPDFSRRYLYTPPSGGPQELTRDQIFHLRGLSVDGILGESRTRTAREAIGLALRAEEKAGRRLGQGADVGGILEHPSVLSDGAFDRLDASLNGGHAGAENAGRWLILEEGLKTAKGFSASDEQETEVRSHQVEEVARAFGVPRPLLMVDETSWGSGVEQLGMLFVRYGLAPWFTAWEQAAKRTCLTRAERRVLSLDFDDTDLLRGLIKDQGEYFARALGSGGHPAWMRQNEVRRRQGLPPDPDGDRLSSGSQGTNSNQQTTGSGNEPSRTS